MWVPGTDRIGFRSDRKGKNGIWTVGFKDGAAAGDPVLIKPDAGDYTPLGVSRDGSTLLWTFPRIERHLQRGGGPL